MEGSTSADNNTDDVLIVSDENQITADQTTPTKGVKRIAQTPPGKEVKKPKLSPTASPEVTTIDDSPQKDAPQTPKTPKTPKVSKEEREKLKREKLEEKERAKAERERILEEKRLEKEKLAEEKRLEKDKKEKEKLEKKAEEDRRKEEKRREAEERKKKEEEEKLKKEEEKNRKRKEEEEKKEAKRKEDEEKKEAKRKEEEAIDARKKRQSEKFLGFFSKVEKKAPVEIPTNSSTWYRPFQPKDGMTMAPILPREPLPEDFDFWKLTDESFNLSTLLKQMPKLEQPKANDMKPKLFQFQQNNRHPYFGTWRKKSQVVRGWCPFAEIDGVDYEVDSDDEWENEPSEGEDCDSDDEGDKDNEEEENEEDDGFLVPPCYLSDGEGEEDDDSTGLEGNVKKERKRVTIDSDDDEDDASDEQRKARLAQRASEWSKRTEKKKPATVVPRAIGPEFNVEEHPIEFKYMAACRFY